MPELLTDDSEMDALLQEQRRVCMPEIMQANARGTGRLHQCIETMREVVGPDRSTIRHRKDEIVIPPGVVALKALLVLSCVMQPQSSNRFRSTARPHAGRLPSSAAQSTARYQPH